MLQLILYLPCPAVRTEEGRAADKKAETDEDFSAWEEKRAARSCITFSFEVRLGVFNS